MDDNQTTVYCNSTISCINTTSNSTFSVSGPPSAAMLISAIVYALICIVGLVGNGLVIFVITRYTKMKTVTNLYILNLSIADLIFIMGLPMLITTTLIRGWPFGYACCKIYYMLTCINMFTGAFTLTVMSGDRFLAVCYPINSMRYRTPKYALIVIALTWIVSFLVMMPIVLYAQTVERPGGYTCSIVWPSSNKDSWKWFTWYNLVLGFVIPVLLISVLYTLLIVRLRTTGSSIKRDKRRPHRKVTRLVSLIIGVYIICWLPYWAFQVHLITVPAGSVQKWKINMFKVFTMLSYCNSMINPLIYAFSNENFRESFISAFKCARDPILGGAHRNSNYVPANSTTVCDPINGKRTGRGQVQQEQQTQYEFMMMNGENDKAVEANAATEPPQTEESKEN